MYRAARPFCIKNTKNFHFAFGEDEKYCVSNISEASQKRQATIKSFRNKELKKPGTLETQGTKKSRLLTGIH
jgi:hypothetical protein